MTEEEIIGYKIVIRALKEPLKIIAQNSGIESADVGAEIARNKDIHFGYDFLQNKYGNLVELGVIDPTKVVVSSLKNAASVAGMLLTTDVVINDVDEDIISKTPRPRSE